MTCRRRIPSTFEWDEAKAEANFRKHGLRFSTAIAVFADPRLLIRDASRAADEEQRFQGIGMIDGKLCGVVYTRRGGKARLISARRTNSLEERIYGQDGHRHP